MLSKHKKKIMKHRIEEFDLSKPFPKDIKLHFCIKIPNDKLTEEQISYKRRYRQYDSQKQNLRKEKKDYLQSYYQSHKDDLIERAKNIYYENKSVSCV